MTTIVLKNLYFSAASPRTCVRVYWLRLDRLYLFALKHQSVNMRHSKRTTEKTELLTLTIKSTIHNSKIPTFFIKINSMNSPIAYKSYFYTYYIFCLDFRSLRMKSFVVLLRTLQNKLNHVFIKLNHKSIFVSVGVFAISASAQNQQIQQSQGSSVDLDRLFHANTPPLIPNSNRPGGPPPQAAPPTFAQNAPRPVQSQPNVDSNAALPTDIFDEEFNPYRGTRHDEFDWSLTKVSNIFVLVWITFAETFIISFTECLEL